MWQVYILRCADQTLYTGVTNDLKRRLTEHSESPLGAKYTRGRRPVELVFTLKTPDKASAMQHEYQIKRLTRSQKLALINGEKTL